jgi:putative glutamine amidotransferase
VLGICFGAQSLNVYRGGRLIQDIPSIVPASLVHDSEGCGPAAGRRHLVRIDPASLVGRLSQSEVCDVNTYHHQAVGQIGKNLRVSATAPDGVVEAVEDTTGRFVVGIQWHPERGWASDPLSQALFSAFVEEAKR